MARCAPSPPPPWAGEAPRGGLWGYSAGSATTGADILPLRRRRARRGLRPRHAPPGNIPRVESHQVRYNVVTMDRNRARPVSLLPLAAAYIPCHVLLDWLSYVHPFGAFGITPWNPSTGLGFVLVLLQGGRALPILFVALLVSNIAV